MFKRLRITKIQLKNFYANHFEKIIEINEKYASPKLIITPVVKFALYSLKFYLVFIIGLIIYKSITLLIH